MSHIVHVAMIEWESSTAPSIHLAGSWRAVAIAAAEDLIAMDQPDDDPEYFHDTDHPERVPADLNALTDEELEQWHSDFHEAMTVPWVTFDAQHVEGLVESDEECASAPSVQTGEQP